MDQATSGAPKDGDEAEGLHRLLQRRGRHDAGTGLEAGQIINEDDGCPDMEANIGAFALPGLTPARRLPPSSVARTWPSRPTARTRSWPTTCCKIMVVDGLPDSSSPRHGTIPALKSLLGHQVGERGRRRPRPRPPLNSRFVPSSENWAAVEASHILPDMLVAISGGADVQEEAAKADAAIEADRSTAEPRRRRREGRTGHRTASTDSRSTEAPTLDLSNGTLPAAVEHADGITPRRRRVRPLPVRSCSPRRSLALALMLGYPLVRLVIAVGPEVRAAASSSAPPPSGSGSRTSATSSPTPSSGTVLRRTVMFCLVNVALTIGARAC